MKKSLFALFLIAGCGGGSQQPASFESYDEEGTVAALHLSLAGYEVCMDYMPAEIWFRGKEISNFAKKKIYRNSANPEQVLRRAELTAELIADQARQDITREVKLCDAYERGLS